MKTALESLRISLRREAEEVISTKRRKIDEKRESLQATNQAQASSTSRTASSSKADKVELRSNKDKNEVDKLLLEFINRIASLAKQEIGKEDKKQSVRAFDDLLTSRMHDEFERQLLEHLKTRRATWIHHFRGTRPFGLDEVMCIEAEAKGVQLFAHGNDNKRDGVDPMAAEP